MTDRRFPLEVYGLSRRSPEAVLLLETGTATTLAPETGAASDPVAAAGNPEDTRPPTPAGTNPTRQVLANNAWLESVATGAASVTLETGVGLSSHPVHPMALPATPATFSPAFLPTGLVTETIPMEGAWAALNNADNFGVAVDRLAPALADARDAAVLTSSTTHFYPSPNQLSYFTLGAGAPVTTYPGLTLTVPSAFYQSLSESFSVGAAGFTATANLDIAGGIKGGVTLGFGDILPDYPLILNAETVGYVQDNQPFTVDPELIATDDAGFNLSLPTALANLTYGLQANAGVGLDFPSVQVGFSVFGHFIGYTFTPPPLYESLVSVGSIQSLPTSKTIDFTGGYATLSELTGGSFTSATTYAKYALPTLSGTGYTAPFLKAAFDPLAALGQYIPELKALDGSVNFDIGSASWSLLSLPIDTSLSIASQETLTPEGFNVTLTEEVGGKTTTIGTHAVQIGTAAVAPWTLQSPSSGQGVIDLTLDYSLTLQVQTVMSLFGSFGLTLDGPQASASLFGQSFGLSPIFQVDLAQLSGDILSVDLPSTLITLTATQNDLVFYGPIAEEITLVNSVAQSYELKAGGEKFKIAKGVFIEPGANTTNPTFGVAGLLGGAGVYNYGSIYPYVAGSGAADHSIGIYLPGGGKIINAGSINYDTGQGHFQGFIKTGIEIGGYVSTVINSGAIVGANYAGIDIAGSGFGEAFVYNDKGGLIDATGLYGIVSKTSTGIDLHNQGVISGVERFGVYDKVGLILYNSKTGYIDGGNYTHGTLFNNAAAVYGGGFAFVENQGFIGFDEFPGANHQPTVEPGSSFFGVDLGNGEIYNSGTIGGFYVGVEMGKDGGATYLENSGLIEKFSQNPNAPLANSPVVELLGSSNTLALAPGARFGGMVYGLASAEKSNYLHLLAGTGIGTLTLENGFAFANFHRVTVEKNAAWLLETTQSYDFNGSTFAGLTKLDRFGFSGLGFTYGDKAVLNSSTDLLSLETAAGVTLDTIQLAGNFGNANFHVSGNAGITYIREFTGNFTNVISAAVGPQVINASSYYGGPLTVAAGVGIGSTLPGAPKAAFGLDFKTVKKVNTAVVGGVTTTTTTTVPSVLDNQGTITGATIGVYLQNAGSIYNKAGGRITASHFGIEQVGTYTPAFIGNSGSIYGGDVGIYLTDGGTIVNMTNGLILGQSDGLLAQQTAFIYNRGTISGEIGPGVVLAGNGAVDNVAGGTISGNAYGGQSFGVVGEGTLVNVANSGLIEGNVGITLWQGGGVTNGYTTIHASTFFGTIAGTTYGIVVGGGAGTISNEVTSPAVGAGFGGLIEGIHLTDGGLILNGQYGTITGNGAFSVALDPGAVATVANQGVIGAISAAGGDRIANAGLGTIASVTGVAGAAGSILTVQNGGTIGGTSVAGPAISAASGVYIYNYRGAGATGAVGLIEGATGIVLAAGGTIVNMASGYIRGSAGAGITLLQGGTVNNAGTVAGTGTGVSLNGGTLIDSGHISGLGGAPAVSFGATDATLLLWAGASFTGSVFGNVAANDVLELGGLRAGTLAGIGSQIADFASSTVLAGSDWTLTDQTTLTGNWSVDGALYLTGGWSAAGQVVVTGSLTNTGTGTGPATGAGVTLQAGGVLNNAGLLAGAAATYHYVYDAPGYPGPAGAGLAQSGGTATNTGTIAGGLGARGLGTGGDGGVGVVLSGGLLTSSGQILGGAGNYGGGIAGNGAAGVDMSGGTLVNSGTINGGGGGYSIYYNNYSPGSPGNGGAGVYLNGGTLINAGVIGGGAGGAWLLHGGSGAAGDAVQFGGTASTLVLDPGAAFNGLVAANAAVDDTLQLVGTTAATLSGLGTEFTGFSTLVEQANANWTLAGSNNFAGTAVIDGALTVGGTLAFDGGMAGGGTLMVGTGHLFSGSGSLGVAVVDRGVVEATSGTLVLGGKLLAQGRLEAATGAVLELAVGETLNQKLQGAGTIALDGAFRLGRGAVTVKNLRVDPGAVLGGAATLTSLVTDNGTLLASGSSLVLTKALSGTGLLSAGLGATATIEASSNFAGTLAGPGTIALDTTSASQILSLTGAGMTNKGTLAAIGPGHSVIMGNVTNTGLIVSDSGTFSLLGTVTNNGTLSATGGLLLVGQELLGNGHLNIGAASTLWLEAGAGAGELVSFTVGTGLLDLGTPLNFAGHIANFASGDLIDLVATAATTLSFASGVLTIDNGTQAVAHLHFSGAYSSASFSLTSDGHGGSLISFV